MDYNLHQDKGILNCEQIVALFVDKMLILSSSEGKVEEMKKLLFDYFKVPILENLLFY